MEPVVPQEPLSRAEEIQRENYRAMSEFFVEFEKTTEPSCPTTVRDHVLQALSQFEHQIGSLQTASDKRA